MDRTPPAWAPSSGAGRSPPACEVDQRGRQAWKRQRLIELGFGIAERLRLVPVDFEAGPRSRLVATT